MNIKEILEINYKIKENKAIIEDMEDLGFGEDAINYYRKQNKELLKILKG